ncbi:WD40 repeat protein [Methanohalophilus levihalophilus]|uniref:WD40 repeat domain-containing protein n=1 Tax=Methanohalophilus levihalophilus TaxID=1431282 RepID=UPI001AE6A864|nr:hypothetical protein [Methanohalophilus levihalophilus]MBP2030491.1 WD40 repeat protein [Methanohalophilus levihalophilus]
MVILTCLASSGVLLGQASDAPQPVLVSYNYERTVNAIDHSPDDRYIAVGLAGGYVRVWDIVEGEDIFDPVGLYEKDRMMQLLSKEPYDITDIEFSPNGKYLLVSSSEYDYLNNEFIGSRLVVYDVDNWEVVRAHDMDSTKVWDVAFSPDSNTYASPFKMDNGNGNDHSTIALWDTKTGEVSQNFISNNYEPYSIAFTPDGNFLVVSFINNIDSDRIVFFDLNNGEIEKTIKHQSVSDLQFSDDGSFFVGGSDRYDEAIAWNTSSGEELYRFKGFSSPPDGISLSTKGDFLVGVDNRKVMVWNVTSKQLLMDSFIDSDIRNSKCVDFSSDDSYIAVGARVADDSDYKINNSLYSRAIQSGADSRQLKSRFSHGDGMVFVYDFQEISQRGHFNKFLGIVRESQLKSIYEFFDFGKYAIFALALVIIVARKLKKK